MSKPHFRRALFVRLDRIGDLVLSLPADQAVEIDQIDWWIPRGLSFVTRNSEPARTAREFGPQLSFVRALALASAVRKNNYDLAVIFHAPWWAGFVIWLAGVPVRIGVRSQWHSFLFFNRGVRQKRSKAELNELEYNVRLIEQGLGVAQGSLPRKTLALRSKSGPPPQLESRLSFVSGAHTYYVVHPGMGGSALNWSTENYASMIRRLSEEAPVVITGTAADEAFLAPLRSAVGDARVIWLDGKLSGDELISVLAGARAVIAPSTGVLHLAASTGAPTLGLFSGIRVQRAVRWGPQGARTAVVEPPMECPSGHACEGMTCARGNCMDTITVDAVVARLKVLIND